MLAFDIEAESLLPATLNRFPNLKHLSMKCLERVNDLLLSHFLRLDQLRVLSFGGRLISIESDALVDLVQHLPNLEQLSIHLNRCPSYAYPHHWNLFGLFRNACLSSTRFIDVDLNRRLEF